MSKLVFIFSILVLAISINRSQSKTHWTSIKVLKKMKTAIDPNSIPQGSCISTWEFLIDPCDNLFTERFSCGFRCDLVVSGISYVTDIELDHAGYSGSIDSVPWGLVPRLMSLDVSSNGFYGSIPESIASLTQLKRLALSANFFDGEIPDSIGKLGALEELFLNSNRFTGKVPESFNGLHRLKRLEIQGNNITGEFPDLGSLQNLNFIDGSDNSISGELPANFPTNLVQLTIRNNLLQGTIPEHIQYLTSLQVIDLSHNSLSGSVPHFLFSHTSLQQLTLSFNRFNSIQTPATLGTQSNLIALDISHNLIQGCLPAFIPFMPRLSALSLEHNRFTGVIPIQYAVKAAVKMERVSQLTRLLLGRNYLFGAIPAPFLEMRDGMVDLSGNCLFRCPMSLFFCRGEGQRSVGECRSFVPGSDE